jgi:tetratricopeptide (TPR) repeat protein
MTNPQQAEISNEFLQQLKDDLVCRRVGQAMARLEKHRAILTSFDPALTNAAPLTGYLAQWVDIGFQRFDLLKDMVSRFSGGLRAVLSLQDYLHLRMAAGMLAMTEEKTEEAIRNLDFVLALEDEINDKELLSIANFWKGRCLRMNGEYDQAMVFAVKGRQLAQQLGHAPMAAVMRVLESWLFFQRGDAKRAIEVLREAETVLSQTDDDLTLGNIHSSYGRIASHQGRYEHALENFSVAIAHYKRMDPMHRNVARSLNNMANVKRLIASQLRGKIDAEAARRRKSAARGKTRAVPGKTLYRQRFEQLRIEALNELAEAEAIYEKHGNRHGLGSVNLNYGYLHLDNGDLELAEEKAGTAFALGESRQDAILMARARLLQCMVENARVDEGIGESTEPGSHARLARDFAQEAADLAKQTQNRRLLANAYVWQGLTLCNRFFDDPETARRCYDQATALSKGEQSNASDDLEALKTKVLRGGNVNPLLRAWSQGSVGDKTFQQISEEFAEIVIPKVWEREGRKVSRVAARLSVSPKKVRRILGKVGRRRSGDVD